MRPPANIHRTSGWLVSVGRGRRRLRKYFRDSGRRGAAAALARAMAHRDKLLRRLPASRKVTRPTHSRINIERIGVWVVSIRRGGRTWQREFRDGGQGPQASLALARAWRDRMLPRLPPLTKIKRRYRLNKTGTIGVTLSRGRQRNGRIFERFRGHWPTAEGGSKAASFSIALYGAREARRLAEEARARGVAELLRARKIRPLAPPGQPRWPGRRP